MKYSEYNAPVCKQVAISNESVLCSSQVQFKKHEGDILWGDEGEDDE